MEKHDPRLLVRHVLMNRDDGDLVFDERFQNRLQFIFGHGEIAIDDRVVVRPGERGPGVNPDFFADLHPAHLRLPADRELHHPVLHLALHGEDFIQ